MKKILLAASVLLISAASFAQTTVPALILSNQVWTTSGSPYIINQNTYIDTGIQVTIMPGVEVKAPNGNTLYIDGEIQALGKSDSVIYFNKLKFDFSAVSNDYNDTTKKGIYFLNSHFTGNGSGTTLMNYKNTSIRVDSCTFVNCYYSLYSYTISNNYNLTWVTNSHFSGDNYGEGYAIYSSGYATRFIIENNKFTNLRGNYIYGDEIQFNNNTLYKVKSTNFYLYGPANILCNSFIRMEEGLRIYTNQMSARTGVLYFNDNILDSMGGGFSNYAAVQLNKNSNGVSSKITPRFNNNNFLTTLGTSPKVRIYSSNSSPSSTDQVDFTWNYWGTNDSAVIEDFIYDYNDNIGIYGRVDFGKRSSTKLTPYCQFVKTCNTPEFEYSATDSVVVFTNKTKGNSPYYTKWKMGDGNVLDTFKSTFTHTYSRKGVFEVCLFIYDTAGTLCDSICKTVEAGMKKCNASFYFAIDTNDLRYQYIINNSQGTHSQTKYKWTFGDGNSSTLQNPTHKYSTAGNYSICLLISDDINNCYSIYCAQININNTSQEIVILDEQNILKTDNNIQIDNIKIFPNPSQGEFNLKFFSHKSGSAKVQLSDVTGKSILEESLMLNHGITEKYFDINSFKNGVYILSIKHNDYIKSERIILNK